MPSTTHPVRRQLVCAVILLGAIGAVFGQSVNFEFVNWDDNVHVSENRYLHPATLRHVLRFWEKEYEHLYIPLSYTWFSAEAKLAEIPPVGDGDLTLNPLVFHIGSLLLHAICTWLVFRLLVRFVNNDMAACFGALLFALHPLQVESVAWVSEQRGLLAALFSLLAIWNYVRFVDRSAEQSKDKAAKYWSRLHYGLALLAFLLALLSKPSAVAVPLMIAVLDRWMLGRTWKQSLIALAPWLVMALLDVEINKHFQQDSALDSVPSVLQRPLIAGDALAYYFEKFLVPLRLAIDYGLTPERAAQDRWYYFAWIIPVTLGVAISRFPNCAAWFTSYGLFLAAVAPVLGFVPFLFQNISTVADRYLYLAMLGPASALAFILARYPWKSLYIASIIWLCWLAVCSFEQTKVWRNSWSLNQHALQVNPHSWSAHNNLAGRYAAEGKFDDAQMHFQRAIEAKPNYWMAWVNLGINYKKQKEYTAAAIPFQHVLSKDNAPQHYEANIELAMVLAEQGKQRGANLLREGKDKEAQQARDESIVEAGKYFQAAIEAQPDKARPYWSFGYVLFESGRVNRAIQQYEYALKVEPDFAQAHHDLGVALLAQQRYDEAVTEFALAIECKPNYAEAHNDLAALLLQMGKPTDAETHYSIALRIRPNYPQAMFGLASALTKQGKTIEAAVQYRKALPLFAPDSTEARRIRDILGGDQEK